jgi:hypothetical protein
LHKGYTDAPKICNCAGIVLDEMIVSFVLVASNYLACNLILLDELMHFGILHMKLYLFMQKVLDINDAGDHFPLYAICLGFELISIIISEVS